MPGRGGRLFDLRHGRSSFQAAGSTLDENTGWQAKLVHAFCENTRVAAAAPLEGLLFPYCQLVFSLRPSVLAWTVMPPNTRRN